MYILQPSYTSSNVCTIPSKSMKQSASFFLTFLILITHTYMYTVYDMEHSMNTYKYTRIFKTYNGNTYTPQKTCTRKGMKCNM